MGKRYAPEELRRVLKEHCRWIESDGKQGACADLRGAFLSDAALRDADLRGVSLRNADLRRADLCGANLRNADLSDARLRNAALRDADLRGANLRRASLCSASLCSADLRGADLRGAYLRGADLRDADLRGAGLGGASLPDRTFVILGEEYFVSIANGDHVRVGCQSHTVAEWRSFTREEVQEMDADAVTFAPRLLDILDFYCGPGGGASCMGGGSHERMKPAILISNQSKDELSAFLRIEEELWENVTPLKN